MRRKRKPRFGKTVSVEMLIAIRGEMDPKFGKNHRNRSVVTRMWHTLHKRMLCLVPGFNKTSDACEKKFNSLFKMYREDKLDIDVYGESCYQCRFYDDLDKWWSQSAYVMKHVSATTSGTDVHVFIDLNFSRRSTNKRRAKAEFHERALVLFSRMADQGDAMVQAFQASNDAMKGINMQIKQLIDKL